MGWGAVACVRGHLPAEPSTKRATECGRSSVKFDATGTSSAKTRGLKHGVFVRTPDTFERMVSGGSRYEGRGEEQNTGLLANEDTTRKTNLFIRHSWFAAIELVFCLPLFRARN